MALLYGRAGRLTAKNGGFRPGQVNDHTYTLVMKVNDAAGGVEEEAE